MKVIHSDTDNLERLPDLVKQSVYNGMDTMLTYEIGEVLDKQLKLYSLQTYNLERALLGPALTMMRRGIKIDPVTKEKLINGDPEANDPLMHKGIKRRIRDLGGMERGPKRWEVVDAEAPLQLLARAVWGDTLNYHSDKQLKDFFYNALYIPPMASQKKGATGFSLDRKILERIEKMYTRGIIFA